MPVTYAAAVGSTANSPAASYSKPTDLDRRPPSPRQTPRTDSPDEDVYILTLQTDPHLHQRMTSLRTKYFPAAINKLDAHLTLFHALPKHKLSSSIIPTIEAVASVTQPFALKATKPFRLNKGIAIGISSPQGGQQGQEVHRALQAPWQDEGFLSAQDAGGCRLHYTIMNKVDDRDTVDQALAEVQQSFEGYHGTVIGLGLWKYDKGWWQWQKMFPFAK